MRRVVTRMSLYIAMEMSKKGREDQEKDEEEIVHKKIYKEGRQEARVLDSPQHRPDEPGV